MPPKEKKGTAVLPPAPKQIDKAYLDQVAKIRRQQLLNMNKAVKFIVFCAIVGALIAFCHYEGMAYATLYMFAYNGKVSGRHDGNVLMANGHGRAYATPALVRNSYTMTQRGILSILSSAWRGLTQSEMESWNAMNLPSTNRLGQAITISGKDAFVRLNANLLDVGFPTNNSAPTLVDVPAITSGSFVADASAGTLAITFAPSPTSGRVEHLIFATAPLSPGVFKPSRSAFRLIGVIVGTQTTPFAAGTAYTNKFGSILTKAGSKIFIQLYGVENSTGQKTPSIGMSSVIVP